MNVRDLACWAALLVWLAALHHVGDRPVWEWITPRGALLTAVALVMWLAALRLDRPTDFDFGDLEVWR